MIAIRYSYGRSLPLQWTGLLATGVFRCGAVTQVGIGRLIDKSPITLVFVCHAAGQVLGLGIATFASGPLLLAGLVIAMTAIFGQIVVDDALIGRFVPQPLRGKAYGIAYCVGFGQVLALATACAGLLLISAVGFRSALVQGRARSWTKLEKPAEKPRGGLCSPPLRPQRGIAARMAWAPLRQVTPVTR